MLIGLILQLLYTGVTEWVNVIPTKKVGSVCGKDINFSNLVTISLA